MDKHYIEEQNVIERFILNQLSPEELDDFLYHQLKHPEIRKEIEEMRQIVNSIRQIPNAKNIATPPKKNRTYINLALALLLLIPCALGVWFFAAKHSQSPTTPNKVTPNLPADSILTPSNDSIIPSALPGNLDTSTITKQPEQKKPTQKRPVIAEADLKPNDFLEVNIGTSVRSTTQMQITSPQPNEELPLNNGLVSLSFRGKMTLSENQQAPPDTQLLLFSNKEADYLEFRPIFTQELLYRPTKENLSFDFQFNKQLPLSFGLYYFLIEDDNGKNYYTGKFFVLPD